MRRPRRSDARRLAFLLPIVAALASCGSSSSPTTGPNATPTAQQQAAFTRANQLRAAAGVAPFTMNQALNVAAVRHAGYQAIRNQTHPGTLLTHYESTDDPPTPTGPPDSSDPLFSGVRLTPRFQAANGGHDLYSPGHVYYEGISSQPGGLFSVNSLWNTVYHRIPLARSDALIFGYGDSDDARIQYPAANVPLVSGFATTDYAGTGTTPVTASHWPNEGAVGVAPSFSTDLESPDPVSSTNTSQATPFADKDAVGDPIHVFIPTSQDWSSVTISLATQAAPGTKISVLVLAGYFKSDPTQPQNHLVNPFPATSITVDASVVGWTWDDELDAGELFIIPFDPLGASTPYQYSIAASAGSDNVNTGTIHFTTQ